MYQHSRTIGQNHLITPIIPNLPPPWLDGSTLPALVIPALLPIPGGAAAAPQADPAGQVVPGAVPFVAAAATAAVLQTWGGWRCCCLSGWWWYSCEYKG